MSSLGENIKKLGFGLMRLPRKNDEIDIEETKIMVDMFMEAGFTYFDTAWVYAGSEDAVRQALTGRYPREAYQLATKNAAWSGCKSREDAIAQFNGSLERTGAGYFDFYLLHNLGKGRTCFFDDFDMWSFVQEKKKEGKIKHVGFSFHSTPDDLEEILIRHPEMEFVQLQINYADWENPDVQSRACYEVARKYGKPIIIMEPVKGGMLASPPGDAAEILKNADPASSYASWAIRFAADLEGVITVLSGMSNIEQMEDNLSFMKTFTGLTDSQRVTIEKARKAVTRSRLISCTSCNYCAKVCPMDIGISGTFTALNHLILSNNREEAVALGNKLVGDSGKRRASECIRCGKCEQVCPQHLQVRELLSGAVKNLKL